MTKGIISETLFNLVKEALLGDKLDDPYLMAIGPAVLSYSIVEIRCDLGIDEIYIQDFNIVGINYTTEEYNNRMKIIPWNQVRHLEFRDVREGDLED